jgi:hypothetical protein
VGAFESEQLLHALVAVIEQLRVRGENYSIVEGSQKDDALLPGGITDVLDNLQFLGVHLRLLQDVSADKRKEAREEAVKEAATDNRTDRHGHLTADRPQTCEGGVCYHYLALRA